MSEMHYVCTRQEAVELVKHWNRFWISNCGCRENRGGCARSRMDLCLFFAEDWGGTGPNFREVPKSHVEEIFREAEEKHLVTRPFRNPPDMIEITGICFCCNDCCEYFTNPGGVKCDKDKFIEQTDMETCTNCGTCVDVCYFGARRMNLDQLSIDRDLYAVVTGDIVHQNSKPLSVAIY